MGLTARPVLVVSLLAFCFVENSLALNPVLHTNQYPLIFQINTTPAYCPFNCLLLYSTFLPFFSAIIRKEHKYVYIIRIERQKHVEK